MLYLRPFRAFFLCKQKGVIDCPEPDAVFLPAVRRGAAAVGGHGGYPDARFADGPGDSQDVEEYAQLREAASLPAEAPTQPPDADAEGNPLDCRVQPSAAPPDRFTGADLAACQAQNDDFIAWLSIPGTPIDYPVVRTGDPDYYLNHTFSGRKSYLGTLFSLRWDGLRNARTQYRHLRPPYPQQRRSHVFAAAFV